jgi:hypothetical protein
MKMVDTIVNRTRGGNKAQGHRALIAFLEGTDVDYGDIPLHSDIKYLSAGKCLQCYFSPRNVILLFLQTENLGQ